MRSATFDKLDAIDTSVLVILIATCGVAAEDVDRPPVRLLFERLQGMLLTEHLRRKQGVNAAATTLSLEMLEAFEGDDLQAAQDVVLEWRAAWVLTDGEPRPGAGGTGSGAVDFFCDIVLLALG